MSFQITTINKSGPNELDLDVTSFSGGKEKGMCVQLTQGMGGLDTPGYIQLTREDARTLIHVLNKWLGRYV